VSALADRKGGKNFMCKSMIIGIMAVLASASMSLASSVGFSNGAVAGTPVQLDVSGLTTKTVNIYISGGEALGGANVFVQVKDGGSDVGGSATTANSPLITAVLMNAPGNVFTVNESGAQIASGGLAAIDGATSASGTVVGTGILAQLTLDLSGWTNRTIPVVISLANPVAGFATNGLTSTGDPVATAPSGTLTLVAVPEPATACLLALGAIPMLRRRRTA